MLEGLGWRLLYVVLLLPVMVITLAIFTVLLLVIIPWKVVAGVKGSVDDLVFDNRVLNFLVDRHELIRRKGWWRDA